RGVETAAGGTAQPDSNVRRAVAQCSEVACRRGNPAGQLSRARTQAVCRGRGELPQRMPLCTGNAGSSVWSRCRSAGARPDAGRAAAASSGTQPAGDGQTACLAGDTACRAQDGAELRAGPGDLVSAAALAALDVVPSESRSPVGQQS